MGDRASLSVTVYACPREQAAVIDQAIESLNMETLAAPDPAWGLLLGQDYTDGQIPINVPGELAEFLAEHAPAATFTVHGGSYCPTPSQVHYHVPGLGLFSSEATDEEQPRFSAGEVLGWIDRWDRESDGRQADGLVDRWHPDELRALVHEQTGQRWWDAIEAARAALPQRWGAAPVIVRPVWPCVHCSRPVRAQDPGTSYASWVHADTGALMRACLDGAGVASPDDETSPVFYG